MDGRTNPEIQGDEKGMNEKLVFVVKYMGPFSEVYKGIVAENETEAFEICDLRGYMFPEIIRVEKLVESKMEKGNE